MARKSSSRIWWILGGTVLLLGGGLLLAKQQGWIGQVKPTEVEFTKVKKTDIVERVSASGKVQPEVEVKISPDVPGEIIGLYVAEGDSVVKGQLLVKIRPDNYEALLARASAAVNSSKADVERAKASLSQTQAQLIRAKTDYERNKKLHDDKVISDADMERSEADYRVGLQNTEAAKSTVEASKFNVQSAEAGLRDANENLRKTTIYAPQSGAISKLNVELGDRVVGTSQMAGTEIMRIANLNNMEVRVDVNENDIVRVVLGDTAEIEVDSYGDRKFKGIVTEIANTANGLGGSSAAVSAASDAVTEFEVKIKILNSSYRDLTANRVKKSYPFKPGMTAAVDIITDRKANVLSVPIAAVTTRGKETETPKEGEENKSPSKPEDDQKNKKAEKITELVFINEKGVAKKREVKTGISDFENIEILSGLKEGDEIISGPFIEVSKRLKDGDKVTKKIDKPKTDKPDAEKP
ncbi:MAG: HlyD family efflux transporter periplasmic adaptor subunit [Runella slithyformis]|nr:MAG: HlyD family efflux transporter periplasmic adaptor subunit [Runella slithyformis]TAE90809.1 MAG: HlyD family efflux transporter periplasmic adaptor subunit [Runella slithyformis]TAF30019.1 MAG: HlyD family efflux transporter periplasmic adaptor subunit [Runella slithyformis]TAF49135.1 MAG: HlyD family efflux transporter periplasmic adaptor subunit [Runella slithyformis]TAF83630.1 MAG: HlyD family efflux transporter periplasmic adaptor subunit [Runella slithyformis]